MSAKAKKKLRPRKKGGGRKRNTDITPPPRPVCKELLRNIRAAEAANEKARQRGHVRPPTSVAISARALRGLIRYGLYLERHVPPKRLVPPAPALKPDLRKRAIDCEARLLASRTPPKDPSAKWPVWGASPEDLWDELGQEGSIENIKKWRRQKDYRKDVIETICRNNPLSADDWSPSGEQ